MLTALSHRAALPVGLFFAVIELGRRVDQLGDWRALPTILEDSLIGVFLIAASLVASRAPARGPVWLAAAWGAVVGVMFKSFFGQLAQLGDPDPSGLPPTAVVAVKGVLLAVGVLGVCGALAAHASRAHQPGRPSTAPRTP